MDRAREAALAGAAHGHLVSATVQERGRGRRGNDWSSPAGNVYASFVARLDVPAARFASLTLAVGLGLRDAVANAIDTTAPAVIKWPNDILIGDAKCAGILVETQTTGRARDFAIVGFGVNVARAPLDGATDLAAHGYPGDAERFLAEARGPLSRVISRFAAGGDVVQDVSAHLAWRGQRVRCGERVGVLIGLAPSGALLLKAGADTFEVMSGTLRRAP